MERLEIPEFPKVPTLTSEDKRNMKKNTISPDMAQTLNFSI